MSPNPHLPDHARLEERFSRLLERVGVEPAGGGVFTLLARHYEAPGRRRHGLGHIGDCLARLDAVRERLRDPEAVELALWFHDAVHDPARDDNVLRSAFLFDREVGIHLPTARADRVHAMIMATAHAGGSPADDDARWAADIAALSDARTPPRRRSRRRSR